MQALSNKSLDARLDSVFLNLLCCFSRFVVALARVNCSVIHAMAKITDTCPLRQVALALLIYS